MMVIALQCLPGCSLPRSVHCIRLKLTWKLSTPGHQVSWKHALWKLPQRLQIVKHLLHGPSSWDKYLWEMSVLCFRTHAKHQPLEVSKKLPPLAYYWISVHYKGWLLPLKQMGGDALKDRILDEIVASPRSLMIARKTSHPLKTAFPCQYLTVDCWRGRGPAQLPAASSWVCCLWLGKALIQLCFTSLVRILHTSHEDIQGVGIFSSRLMLELYPAYSISCLLPWQDSMFLGHVSLMCTIILLCWCQEMGLLCTRKQKGRYKSIFSLTEAWNFMKSVILAEAERFHHCGETEAQKWDSAKTSKSSHSALLRFGCLGPSCRVRFRKKMGGARNKSAMKRGNCSYALEEVTNSENSRVERDLRKTYRETDPMWHGLKSNYTAVIGEGSEQDSGMEVLLCRVLLFVLVKILATMVSPMDLNVFL